MIRRCCALIVLSFACASPSSSDAPITSPIESSRTETDSLEQPNKSPSSSSSSSAIVANTSLPGARPEFTIYRDELNRATQSGKSGYLLQQLAPEANRRNGRFYGWRITSLFPADPQLCAGNCDIQVGDIVLSINGSPLERPEQLSALVDTIPSLEYLEILSIRDEKLRKRRYSILDRP